MAFLGGKVKVIILNHDQTFRERKIKTSKTELNITKNWKPSFVIGRSVFRELVPTWRRILLGQKPRNLVIISDRSHTAFELKKKVGRGGGYMLEPNYWTPEEEEKFIAKVVAKSKAEQKMISPMQFLILAGIGVIGLILMLILLTRGRFYG